MCFRQECIEDFKGIYLSVKDKIESQPGCFSVELLEDIDDPCIFFTYSIWEDRQSLGAYRNSDLFKNTWLKTKALFAVQAEAWSLDFVAFGEP